MIQVLQDGLNEWNARDIKLDVHVQAQGIFFFVGETQINESSSSLIITCYTFNTTSTYTYTTNTCTCNIPLIWPYPHCTEQLLH